MAKHYGCPPSDIVIEPFAGSACYSTYWEVPRAILCDVSPDICAVWNFLISATPLQISRIPDVFECDEHLNSIPNGAQQLVRFWIAKGRAEPSSKLSSWYFDHRDSAQCKVWGPSVKDRIKDQLPLIRKWEIHQVSFEFSPCIEGAHWHIDPPYNNEPGRRYPHKFNRFNELSQWAKTRPGTVDVCENAGADWLEFDPLWEINTTRGKRSGATSLEAVWTNRDKTSRAVH